MVYGSGSALTATEDGLVRSEDSLTLKSLDDRSCKRWYCHEQKYRHPLDGSPPSLDLDQLDLVASQLRLHSWEVLDPVLDPSDSVSDLKQ